MTTFLAVYIGGSVAQLPHPHGAADLLVLLIAVCAVVQAIHGLVFGGRPKRPALRS